MFKEYLISAKNNGTPVSLYTDKDNTEGFSFGLIQAISNDWVLLASISAFGFYDGFVIRKYSDVYRCESKDSYGERIFKLYHLRKQNHPVFDLKSDNLVLDMIQYAQSKQFVVSIEVHNSGCDDLQGFVTEIQNDLIRIEQLDDDGNSDGESVISLEDITRIVCDSDNEMTIKLLAGNR